MSSERPDHPNRNYNSVLYTDCGHDADADYAKDTGIDLSSADYTPTHPMHGLICGDQTDGSAASGDVHVVLHGGGEMVLPVKAPAGEFVEILKGTVIVTVKKTTTTFNGHIFPMF